MAASKNSLKNFPPDLLIVSGLPLIGVIALLNPLFWLLTETQVQVVLPLVLGVASVGAGLIFWAKLPLYRSGIYFSFGPSSIPETRRIFYYWGMGLALGGCILAALIIPLK